MGEFLPIKMGTSEVLIIYSILRRNSLRSSKTIAAAHKHYKIRKGMFRWYLGNQYVAHLFLRPYVSKENEIVFYVPMMIIFLFFLKKVG